MNSVCKRLFHPYDSFRKCIWAVTHWPMIRRGLRIRRGMNELSDEQRKTFAGEIQYVRSVDFYKLFAPVFPYDVVRQSVVEGAVVKYDEECNLPYVQHGDIRLYYPSSYDNEKILGQYRWYVDFEGITEQCVLAKVPHSYVDEDFFVEKGDVLVDVGSAEALFTLHNIEKASRAYVFETLPEWSDPLMNTFSRWSDKVTVVNNFVGGADSDGSVRLSDVLVKEAPDATYFIKMDIEGGERDVIAESRDFLSNHRVKLSCCVYHRADDTEKISRALVDMGYSVSFSDGYMIPTMGGLASPYFRHGVIHARNF